jgi:hypothetical protein
VLNLVSKQLLNVDAGVGARRVNAKQFCNEEPQVESKPPLADIDRAAVVGEASSLVAVGEKSKLLERNAGHGQVHIPRGDPPFHTGNAVFIEDFGLDVSHLIQPSVGIGLINTFLTFSLL